MKLTLLLPTSSIKAMAVMIALCLLSVLSSGQIAREMDRINEDSLIQVLPNLEGIDKIDALNKIAFKISYKDPDSCISIASQTMDLSESIDYKKGKAIALFNIGNGYFFQDSLKLTVVNYLNAIRIFDSTDVSVELCLLYRIQAYLNWRAGRLDKSLQYARNEIDIARELSNDSYEAGANIQASVYFTESFRFDSASIYLDTAINITESLGDSSLLASSYFYKGYNAIKRYQHKYLEEDKIYLTECISWYSKHLDLIGGVSNNPAVYTNLAASHLKLGSKEDSILCLKYTEIQKSMADTLSYWYYHNLNAYRRLGSLKAGAGDYHGAIELYMEGLEKAKKARNRYSLKSRTQFDPFYSHIAEKYYYEIMLGWIYFRLYRAYKALGDFETAHEYYILWQKSRDRIFLEDNENLIAMLEAESETEKTQNQIAQLERDKQLTQFKAVQARNLNIIIVITFAILLLVGMLLVRQNKLKSDHKNTLLKQKLLRLQMNPHFIFNALSSIHSLMNPKDLGRASDYLGSFSRLLRSSLESSREDYILLEDEVNGIKNYLELQQLRFDNKFKYQIDVDPKIDLESAIMPPMLIQPFIENAIEHGIRHKSEKGNIHIRFKLDNEKIICEVEDDGVGREKAWEVEYAKKRKHKSLATEIISDRINILNKKLKQKISLLIIDKHTDEGKTTGTLVILNLPYLLD